MKKPIDNLEEYLVKQRKPDKELIALVKEVRDSHERRKRILDMIQESLSQLRLDMKYLVFDLEATRRERDELKNR